MKRNNVMAIWKEFNPSATKSMKDDFRTAPSPLRNQIISYLHNGELVLASPASAIDVFSGEVIEHTKCMLTDGEFSWSNTLPYYIQKYNLQIPKELETKILQSKQNQ